MPGRLWIGGGRAQGNSAAENRTSCSWTSNFRECPASNALRELRRLMPSVNIIMVTVYEDNGRIFKALQAGANGYIIKSRLSEDFKLQAIRDVFKGGAPRCRSTSREGGELFSLPVPCAPRDKDLSAREDQVLKLLAFGVYLQARFGEKLDIGVETSAVSWASKTSAKNADVRGRIEAVY